jgi:hypothetical protein
MVVVEGDEAPLAARRACRTCLDGATSVEDACIEARTGASIRGSNMAVVMSNSATTDLETFRSSGGVLRFWH